jgi:hypothetical protein
MFQKPYVLWTYTRMKVTIAPLTPLPCSNYDDIMDQFSLHQFIIRKGKVLDNTPEFASYQRSYRAYWGSIERIIRYGRGGCRVRDSVGTGKEGPAVPRTERQVHGDMA